MMRMADDEWQSWLDRNSVDSGCSDKCTRRAAWQSDITRLASEAKDLRQALLMAKAHEMHPNDLRATRVFHWLLGFILGIMAASGWYRG